MVSHQAPRSVRLELEAEAEAEEKTRLLLQHGVVEPHVLSPLPLAHPELTPSIKPTTRRPSLSDPAVARLIHHSSAPAVTTCTRASTSSLPPALEIRCHVRTRIPTPHGHVFLHLYKNNIDEKEHLAFVADQAQMDALPGDAGPSSMPFLRSETLDAVSREGETEIERIVRGAYIGRLSASTVTPSVPWLSTPMRRTAKQGSRLNHDETDVREPPLVRIHSECFTGETIGSQRCDCGEQLDEAFRLITEAGRGVVVYLRQEGRGIGLLEKMRAYNLQDLGHDTVSANLLLGHGADLRTYDIAGAILRDLAIPEVRLLTNNPDKIKQIENEGIVVVERVEMVPRAWMPKVKTTASGGAANGKVRRRKRNRNILSGSTLLALATEAMLSSRAGQEDSEGEEDDDSDDDDDASVGSTIDSDDSHNLRRAGVGMIGGSVTRSAELDKYLRTKIERMGHLLDLPSTPPSSRADTPSHHHQKDELTITATSKASDECGTGCECSKD